MVELVGNRVFFLVGFVGGVQGLTEVQEEDGAPDGRWPLLH
jgi:hypothetical protein